MKDYAFRTIKSLLRKELNLTKKMQDDYDRIQLADLLEDKFPQDAGLGKLIEVCGSIEELKELTDNLKREKAKVNTLFKGSEEVSQSRDIETYKENWEEAWLFQHSSPQRDSTVRNTQGFSRKETTLESVIATNIFPSIRLFSFSLADLSA